MEKDVSDREAICSNKHIIPEISLEIVVIVRLLPGVTGRLNPYMVCIALNIVRSIRPH